MSMLVEFPAGDGKTSLVIDEDGVACYAYIRFSGKLVAHAWLYNCPEESSDGNRLLGDEVPPERNLRDFVRDGVFDFSSNVVDYSVEWPLYRGKGEVCCIVRHRCVPVGMFRLGERVGFSIMAKKENKLARPLPEDLV